MPKLYCKIHTYGGKIQGNFLCVGYQKASSNKIVLETVSFGPPKH